MCSAEVSVFLGVLGGVSRPALVAHTHTQSRRLTNYNFVRHSLLNGPKQKGRKGMRDDLRAADNKKTEQEML